MEQNINLGYVKTGVTLKRYHVKFYIKITIILSEIEFYLSSKNI